jgi:hypothetical protein
MASLVRFVGVYDADHTLWGEVSYWVGARLGRRHCSLCDITHGLLTERSDWKRCISEIEIPFVTYHRNDLPAPLANCTNKWFPIVVAEFSDGAFVTVAGPAELESCNGSPAALVELLTRFATSQPAIRPEEEP